MEGYTVEDMVAYATGKLQGGWTTDQVEASIRETLATEQWPAPAIEAAVRQVAAQVQEGLTTPSGQEPPQQGDKTQEHAETRTIMEMMQRMMNRMDAIEERTALPATPPTGIPTPPQPVPTPISIKRRYPDPEMFDGTRSKYQGWKYACQAKLVGDGALYPSDVNKNQYILLRTKDKAMNTLLPWMRIHEQKPVSELWAFMDIEFGDQHEEESAIDKLQSIRQNKDSIRNYRQRFNELLLRSGEQVSDRLKKSWFLRGLNKSTYNQMSSISPQLGFTQFTNEAIRLADFHYRGQFTNQPPMPASQSTPRRQSPDSNQPVLPDQMDWQPTTSNQGRSEKRRAKWVSKAERQRRQNNQLCVRCGAGGHYYSKCPYLPAARPPSPTQAAQAAAPEILPPPLLEDDLAVDSDSGKE